MELDSINKNMLELLKASINNQDCEINLDLSNWDDIYKELQAQTVLSLTENVLLKHLTDKEDTQNIIIDYAKNLRYFHKLMQTQEKLISLLNKNDIKVVILKGAAAGQYYPNPELRQYGDIDALVLPQDYDKAFYLLKENSCKNEIELDDVYQRHIGFETPNGIRIELHRYFYLNDKEISFDKKLHDQFNNIKIAEVCNYKVPTLPTKENGLVLLGHINHHMAGGGIGLRQIIDWIYYVKNNLDDSYWNNEFYQEAKQIGMDTLAKTVTKMCKRYLGLSNKITWCDDADDALVDDLLSFILRTGNFGKKVDKERRHFRSLVHNYLTNPKLTFAYLSKRGMIHMKEAGIKPRKNIAWLYQIIHLTKMLIKQNNKDVLLKDVKQGTTEIDLLKRLKIQSM